MKIAHYINNNGEKKEISADNINYNIDFNRLTCPCCGERVDWVNGKILGKFFKHRHSSYRYDCENYNSSISNSRYIPPYEYEGLPLYLIKELGTYSLAIGLYGVDESTIKEAESVNLEIRIDTDKNTIASRRISTQNFFPQRMNFIKLREVKQQYKLRFSQTNIPHEIKQKWTTNINGVGPNGAIFYAGNYGGKKVSTSVGMKVNEEYLLFTSYDINRHINGIKIELLQEINYSWISKFKIYKFTIRQINRETISFCEKFDMKLQYSKPEVVPIWPPCTVLDQELIYSYDSSRYFVLKTDNENCKDIYSHVSRQKLPSQSIGDSKYLLVNHIKSNDFISIKSLKNQFIYSLIKPKEIYQTAVNPIVQSESNANIINISANAKVFVNHFRNNILIDSRVIKDETAKQIKVSEDSHIVILHGVDIIKLVEGQAEIHNPIDINILDKELLDKIIKCKGELVVIPDNFKWMVLKQKRLPLTYRELQKQMKNGKTTIKLINLLKSIR